MIQPSFERATIQQRGLLHLLFLAVSSTTFGVIALTLGTSLFLHRAGAAYLPLSYVLMGILSIPIYGGLSQIVDTTSRPKLCRILLGVAIAFSFLAWFLLPLDTLPIYYLIHIGLYVQWILMTEVLFPSLVSDYFTSLDWKRYTPILRMANAVGGLLGGALLSGLVSWVSPQDVLLYLPLCYGVMIGQLFYLEKTETPLEVCHLQPPESLLKSLNHLPDLLSKYPIIGFLCSSTFLFILLYSFAEFEYYSIYSQTFADDQDLTRFLAIVRVVNSILPLVLLALVTKPLIRLLGVTGISLIYPLTTLASFGGLVWQGNLGTAVFANLNTNGIEDSLNQPIQSLNYNAVPYALVGRVRVIGNGLFFALGLATAGVLLQLCQLFLTPLQVGYGGLVLSGAFFVLRYQMGKSYLQSLLTMLRTGVVKVKDVQEGLRLPGSYREQIQNLLTSEERSDQILGLELATRAEASQQFLPLVQPLLNTTDEAIRQAIITYFSERRRPEMVQYLRELLRAEGAESRLFALEALIASDYSFSPSELEQLLASLNPQIRALVCVAAVGRQEIELQQICREMWLSPLETATQQTIIRTVRRTQNRQFIPLLQTLLADAPTEITRQGLEALTRLARPGDLALGKWAEPYLAESDGLVRAIALKLLGIIRHPDLLLAIATGLNNEDLNVRMWAASALASYGNDGLKVANIYLNSTRSEVREAAIASVAKVRTPQATHLLYQSFKPHYQLLQQTERWLSQMPLDAPMWEQLAVIIQDYQQRLLHRVLYLLSCLDREGTLRDIRQILHSPDPRLQANAVETLLSLKHRRFVLPLVPLLEHHLPSRSDRLLEPETLLKEVLAAPDRWIRVGGLFVISQNLPQYRSLLRESLLTDPDPLIQRLAYSLTLGYQENLPDNDWFLHQIFFLKETPFFRHLFLEELLALNPILDQKSYTPSSIIYTSHTSKPGLYLVESGRVEMRVGEGFGVLESVISRGQTFCEMSLFDDSPTPQQGGIPRRFAIATTPCTVLFLSRQKFERAINTCPRLLLSFTQILKF
ncbi:cyclic nucleotide-binding domain-containing protein [Spirulina subsalsa FACHB-351]|uniref:Cyclic nucleotide-binding domain-containing protein n=1 Tax=Spirulina subsalsa FACHB-351 TaxID=234711 RepID=A0ABT3LBW7_9CYAN|nr:HEAT repeat domain-containing protein [Spirulina subsalsa]MCW6038470.1 cyclic nucleotide-binding domain-containing protein [Spirulina subsalsa FACHB-351]